MNTEEINLMMQLVEKIQNNNTNDGLLTPHQLNQVQEFLKEHLSFVDWDSQDKLEVMLIKKMEELYSFKLEQVGNKSDSPKFNQAMQAKAEKTAKQINNQTERIKELEKDVEVMEQRETRFVLKQESINKEVKHAIANVPKIKPVDTFSNSDEHRALLSQINRLESFKSNIHQDIKLIQEWIKATKPKQRDKIKAEFEDSETGTEDSHADKYPQSPNGPGSGVDKDDWENISTSKLEVNVRTISLFINNKINTLWDLVQFTEKDLLMYKNFGRSSLEKLKTSLLSHGLKLKKD